ncbi:MAG: diguanylate cyclase, partial [Lachnospiraceae bacterium]
MKIGKRTQKNRSIFHKMFPPVLAILLIVIGLYTVLIQQNVLSFLQESAFHVFQEQVEKRKISLQNEMNTQWSGIEDNVTQVVQQIETTLQNNNASATQISYDANLNQKILNAVMGDVIDTLKNSNTSELFFILNGTIDAQNIAGERAGIYLRNSNPASYSNNNGTLLFERGIPSISKEWKIPLDSFWTVGFSITENENCDYFNKPFLAASSNEKPDFHNFVYWDYSRPINEADRDILTYSVPLILSTGEVIGVMGVGLSEDYICQKLNNKELGDSGTGAYLLARGSDFNHPVPILINGTAYNKASWLQHEFSFPTHSKDEILSLKHDNDSLRVSIQELKLYNSNTPFEQEKWMLMGVQQESVLLETYHTAQKTLGILITCTVLISMMGLYFINRILTIPIRQLVAELGRSDPNQPIHLPRLHVDEIDELSISIENLSERVAAAFFKISTIIELSGSGIGVFEYKEKENLVFVSSGLYEMLEWGTQVELHTYVNGSDFSKRFKELLLHQMPTDKNLIQISTANGNTKWIRLNEVTDENSVLGVLTDVTAEILEKQQIEYERDYDLLTNLYNRRAFEEQVQKLLKPPSQIEKAVLLVWDLDNLKYINDTYGHITGDDYIATFAKCLLAFSQDHIIVARRSGDEFLSFIYGEDSYEKLNEWVQKIWNHVQDTSILLPNKNPYRLRVSAGKSWYPSDAQNYTQLFQYADFAMYTVKHSRKGTIQDFNPELYRENRILLQGPEEFNNLLEHHLIRYMLQPIMSAVTGNIYGYEMLMRSQVELFQSPFDILRMAHSQSRLYDLEVMTWFEAMHSFSQLFELGKLESNCKIFINSIANQIMQPKMLELFRSTYQGYLNRLVCEFTEEEQDNGRITTQKVNTMRKWNAMVAIDDYGCGYNNEAVLLKVQPNIVKIDMNIV